MPILALRQTSFRNLLANTDIQSDAELARRMGITPGQLWRVLAEQSSPGNRFIAGMCDVFGVEAFGELFAIVHDGADA